MTIEKEQIQLMDWLRKNQGIGVDCRHNASAGKGKVKLPEQCALEVAEYFSWEYTLRSAGPKAESAYYLIRKAADFAWRDTHGSDWVAELESREAAYCSSETHIEWPGVGHAEYTLQELLERNDLIAKQLRRGKAYRLRALLS